MRLFKKKKPIIETYQVIEPFKFYQWDMMLEGYTTFDMPVGTILRMKVGKNGHIKKIKINNNIVLNYHDIGDWNAQPIPKKYIISKCRRL